MVVLHPPQPLRTILDQARQPLLPRHHVHADDRGHFDFLGIAGNAASSGLCGNFIDDQGRI